uniref:SH3 domain-containing kinase-binding protein 1-like n=1 Tax=Sinocyclocheilus rhinocerous TaxID=307959 RepID=A0A673I9D0_9TELE
MKSAGFFALILGRYLWNGCKYVKISFRYLSVAENIIYRPKYYIFHKTLQFTNHQWLHPLLLSFLEVLVLLDFEATMPDELTICAGDVVKNVSKGKEEGWLEGELRGKRGMFPCNFVKEVPVYLIGESNREPRSMRKSKKTKVTLQARKCEVAFPYTPANEDELDLVVGETIEILREIEDGWWIGKKNNRVGAFPSNFVKEIFVPSKATARPKLSEVFSKEGKVQQRPSLRRKTPSGENSKNMPYHTDDVSEGELNGRRGFFPDNFVMVIPADALHTGNAGQPPVRHGSQKNAVNQMPVMDQNSSDTNPKTETKSEKPDTKDFRSDPPGKIKLPGLHKPPVPPPPVKGKPIKLVPKNEEPQLVSPKQPPASPVQKEATEPQSSPSTKTDQVAKTTSPPKTPTESKAVAQEESASLASVLTELKDLRMSLDLLKAQHERDIKELKDELKDEMEKRMRLQVSALRKTQKHYKAP